MKKIKVIILGTGNVSSYAVKALSLRENIEIIGVTNVHSAIQTIR